MVDRNRIKGSARKVSGDLKKGAGRALGDRKLQAEGSADRVRGKTRHVVGSARDAMRSKGNGRSRPTDRRSPP